MVPVFSLLAASALVFQAGTPSAAARPEITPEARGDIAMARKMFREAVDYYKEGADKNAVLANKVGIAYHQQLDLNDAKKWYEKSIKLNPKYAEAINNLGTVYYAQKSYRRAIVQYRRALTLSPNSASFFSNLGTAYFARKQYDEAFKAYDQALAFDPEVFEHRGTQGTILQERTVEEKAKFHYALAKSYAKVGAVDRALQYIRMSVEEGFKEREKFFKDPEFAGLQDNEEFKKIMTTEQKAL